MIIESLDNKIVKYVKKLEQKKYRDLDNVFVVFGNHLVVEALKYGKVLYVLTTKEFDIDVLTYRVSDKVMKYLSNDKSYGDILAVCRKNEEKDIVGNMIFLDNIQDPGNLGTIIRSASAFNIDNIILSDTSVDLYNPKVISSTEGMIFHLNILRRKSIPFLESIKNNYSIIGTSPHGGVSLDKLKIDNNYCIVIGSEGKGISDEVFKMCDKLTYIKMNERCESLNASVCASIIMYELGKDN